MRFNSMFFFHGTKNMKILYFLLFFQHLERKVELEFYFTLLQVGSIEGRVGVHHLDDAQQSKNFTFKCHREGNEIYSVNSLNFHPVRIHPYLSLHCFVVLLSLFYFKLHIPPFLKTVSVDFNGCLLFKLL